MKKLTRSIVSVLMVAALMLTMCVSAFAASAKPVYVCLGDSNASGYNTTGWTENRVEAPEAYHSKVAKALGAELRPFGTGGFRTDEILYMLDPTFEMDWSYADICNGKVHQSDLDAYKAAYVQAVKDADYLTIQVGANDVMGEDFGFAMMKAFYMPIKAVDDLKAAVAEMGELSPIMEKLVGAAETAIKVGVFVGDLAPRLAKTYSDFMKNWDRIIECIYEMNPDVKIVAVSVMNPFSNTSLLETTTDGFKLGTLIAPVFDVLNVWMQTGSKYADSYAFCDTRDIKAGNLAFTQDDFMEAYLPLVHPTDEGHTVMAERIVDIFENWD